MRQESIFALAFVVAGCGASGAQVRGAPAEPKPAPASTPSTLPPEAPLLLVEYVAVHRRWVEPLVPTFPEAIKAWSEAPENAALVGGTLRHILIRVPTAASEATAKKKTEIILARLDKGEDFAKLALQLSEDATSKVRGGEVPLERRAELPPEVTAAFASLAPGKHAAAPVRSAQGYHIVRQDRAAEEALEHAYRKAKAPELSQKLGAELTARLKGGAAARSAIADAVLAVLGERGASDANRPPPHSVPLANVEHVRLPAAARAALTTFARSAQAGDVLPSPAVDGDTLVVARVRAP